MEHILFQHLVHEDCHQDYQFLIPFLASLGQSTLSVIYFAAVPFAVPCCESHGGLMIGTSPGSKPKVVEGLRSQQLRQKVPSIASSDMTFSEATS